MSRRGRSTRSNRESDRESISIPLGSYQTITGRQPINRQPSGRTPKTIDMEESK